MNAVTDSSRGEVSNQLRSAPTTGRAWSKLLLFFRAIRGRPHRPHEGYQPEEHYMRGPGAATKSKVLSEH